MTYKVIWKLKTAKTSFGTYIEYLDITGLKSCLDFLESSTEYELVSVTPYEE